ncbi:MAG: ATP-binding cassette domain-containing protein [Streptosporangiales bacterium]|nr:ATP-binding cassette domain-containing protein [Streptosporangiales bacterium]
MATAVTDAEAERPPASGAQLSLHDLVKTYPGQTEPAVDHVNLSIEPGKLLALLGPSGCGKTTTLRMVAGLIDPTAGRIEVGGVDLTHTPAHRRGMGMVFQSYALFPHLDVARNVAFGLEMRKVGREERQRKVEAALEQVQLRHLARRKITALSGGQQQRVALARALVVEPTVLLLDEPLSNLDAKLREQMRAEIRDIQQRTGITTVFVTHDQDEALSIADVVAVISQGRVEQVGTPEEIYERPASKFVADFIGRANLLPGHVVDCQSGRATVDVDGLGSQPVTAPHPAEGEVTVLVRPHRVTVAEEEAGGLQGTVVARSYTGDMVSTTVDVDGHRLVAETLTGEGTVFPPGEKVTVSWRPEDALVLPS